MIASLFQLPTPSPAEVRFIARFMSVWASIPSDDREVIASLWQRHLDLFPGSQLIAMSECDFIGDDERIAYSMFNGRYAFGLLLFSMLPMARQGPDRS